MRATCYKTLLAVISVLVFALVYSSFSAFHVFAAPPAAGLLSPDADCDYDERTPTSIFCCWTESATEPFGIKFCQTCEGDGDCGAVYPVYPELEQPPTPPSPGPGAPLGSIKEGGVLPELQQTLPSPPTPPVGGISEQPPLFGRNVPLQGGVFGQPATTTTPIPTPSPFGQIAPEGQVQLPPATTLGEGGEQAQSRTFSPTGYCVPFNKITCVPCDPGLPGAGCIPQSEWPPASTTGEEIPQAQLPSEEEEGEEEQPPGTLSRPPIGGMPPEAQIAPKGDAGTQPQIQDDGAAEE
jgi:hypothetical protein